MCALTDLLYLCMGSSTIFVVFPCKKVQIDSCMYGYKYIYLGPPDVQPVVYCI
jgi:hypothetical protein